MENEIYIFSEYGLNMTRKPKVYGIHTMDTCVSDIWSRIMIHNAYGQRAKINF